MTERLRLIEDYVNQLLHGEGYKLRLYRHSDRDLVDIILDKVTLSTSPLGDQCPKVESRCCGRSTVHEKDLRGD